MNTKKTLRPKLNVTLLYPLVSEMGLREGGFSCHHFEIGFSQLPCWVDGKKVSGVSKPGYPLAVHKVPLARWPWHAATCPTAAVSCAARTDLPAGCTPFVARACTADFPRLRTPARMTPIPARFDLMRCTGLVFIMAENQAPREHGAGDHISCSN